MYINIYLYIDLAEMFNHPERTAHMSTSWARASENSLLSDTWYTKKILWYLDKL